MSVEAMKGARRFEALLAGRAMELHDIPLLQKRDWLVAPTLGAIIPNWFLVIPSRPVLNFRNWALGEDTSPHFLLTEFLSHLGLSSEEVVWFEHGPSLTGTTIGCGLDHAHLHVLVRPPFTFDEFEQKARALSAVSWREGIGADPYQQLRPSISYCVAGSGERHFYAENVEATGSQFFRRVVAALIGQSDFWDYREFAYSGNVQATIECFKRLESLAERDG